MKILVLFLCLISNGVLAQKWVDPPPKYQCPLDDEIYPCKCLSDGDEGLVIECNNTNLAAAGYAIKLVKSLIHTLRIKNCNIGKLYGNIFTPLTLTVLEIEDTPIKDISDDTMNGVAESLKELYMRNTRLTRVPPSLKNLTSLRVLEIDSSDIRYLPPGVFDGMKKLKDLRLSGSKISDVDQNTFNGLRKLKKLSLNGNQLKTFPRNTFKGQINLEYLDISHNVIDKLQPYYFNSLTKLLWLNISHNALEQMQSRAFSRNSVLRVLHLNNNMIKSLDANSFRGMRFMRRLYFSDNLISRVGRGTFRSVNRVGTIDLARNKLTKIDFQMFADLQFVDTLDLAENQITEIQREAFKNIFMTKINISHNLLEFVDDGVFRNAENMTFLDLSHNQIHSISEAAFDENSYAGELLLQNNMFTSFGGIPMKTQRGIRVLNASGNAIKDIPKNTFPKNLFELHTIDVSHNQLEEIGSGVFTPLFSLRNLFLHHNIMEKIGSATFGKLPSLLMLDLRHNKIHNMRKTVFSGLNSIRKLYLDHNQLEFAPSPPISLNEMYLSHNAITEIKGRQPWPVMNSLLLLDMDYNQLGDTLEGKGDRFAGLNTVTELRIRGNGISKVPWEAIGALRSLRTIHMDDNKVVNLTRKAFGKLPSVAVITLSGNKLNNISTNAFEDLLQLVTLDLSSNNLSYVPPGALQGLRSLRTLNMSRNHIQYLQNKTHGLLEDCTSIKFVDLSHNKVPFITDKMFPESPWFPYRLEHIDLSHNLMPVLTGAILRGTKYLKYFNISHNMLNDVRPGVLPNMTSLEILDLSGNRLTDKLWESAQRGPSSHNIETERFGILPNLTSLSLAGNKFSKLPAEETLSQMENLNLLDVRKNNISEFYPTFTDKIKRGMKVFYGEDNPLICNCFLRPVVYWLISSGRYKGEAGPWDEAVCRGPQHLKDRTVGSLLEEQLICDNNQDANKFKLNPDLLFTVVKPSDSHVQFRWSLNTNEDVSDFQVELRTKSIPPKIVHKFDVPYAQRFGQMDLRQIFGDSGLSKSEVEICVSGKTSEGRIRRWRQTQCTDIKDIGGYTGFPSSFFPSSGSFENSAVISKSLPKNAMFSALMATFSLRIFFRI